MMWVDATKELPVEGVMVLTLQFDPNGYPIYRVDEIVRTNDPDHPFNWHATLISDWNKVDYWSYLPSPPN